MRNLKTYSESFLQFDPLCSDILHNLNINKFGFIRFLENSQYFACGNYPLDYVQEYQLKVNSPHPKVIEAIGNAHLFQKGKITWLGGEENDKNIITDLSNKYGLGSRLVIAKKDKVGFYLFYFVMQMSLGDRRKFLLENYDLLYDLSCIVKIKAELVFRNLQPSDYLSFSDFSLSRYIYNQEFSLRQQKMMRLREMLTMHNQKFKQEIYNLSNREIECVNGLIKGQSYKEIGYDLNISFRTVETHINHIKQKTGLHYKSELRKLFLNSNNSNVEVR